MERETDWKAIAQEQVAEHGKVTAAEVREINEPVKEALIRAFDVESSYIDVCDRLGEFSRSRQLGLGGEPYDRLVLEYAISLEARVSELEAEVGEVSIRLRDAERVLDEHGIAKGDSLGQWTVARRIREAFALLPQLAEAVKGECVRVAKRVQSELESDSHITQAGTAYDIAADIESVDVLSIIARLVAMKEG